MRQEFADAVLLVGIGSSLGLRVSMYSQLGMLLLSIQRNVLRDMGERPTISGQDNTTKPTHLPAKGVA